MTALLRFARLVDVLNTWLGRLAMLLIFAAVVVSALNASARKAFNIGSNAFLEIQWYFFAGVFMLGVGYAFMKNVHVRIDFVSSRLSKRANAIIDAVGIVVFVVPLSLIMIDLSWPLFANAWTSGETSSNAGGLIRWPVVLLIPVGFGVLLVTALAELVKRVAFLRGVLPEPFNEEHAKSDEELLAEELAAEAARTAQGEAR